MGYKTELLKGNSNTEFVKNLKNFIMSQNISGLQITEDSTDLQYNNYFVLCYKSKGLAFKIAASSSTDVRVTRMYTETKKEFGYFSFNCGSSFDEKVGARVSIYYTDKTVLMSYAQLSDVSENIVNPVYLHGFATAKKLITNTFEVYTLISGGYINGDDLLDTISYTFSSHSIGTSENYENYAYLTDGIMTNNSRFAFKIATCLYGINGLRLPPGRIITVNGNNYIMLTSYTGMRV